MDDQSRNKATERKRKWRAVNPEKSAEASRRYRQRNPEKAKDAQDRYKASHPGVRAEISARYRERNLEAERTRIREAQRKRYASPDWYFSYIERYYGPGAGEHYKQQHAKQGGVCAICSGVPKKEKLHLDHNHGTREFRGLLCGDCNRGLGLFKENVEYLKRLIAYIEEWHIDTAAA